MKEVPEARYTQASVMLQILAEDDLSAGQVVATRYRLSHVVGEGGMGVVWAATHLITEKRCALKFLKPTRASDPRSHHRLIHEARAACRVRHPNVAPVHDVLELPNGVPFIVMDLLEGESLARRLADDGRMPLADALPILRSVVDAVAAAHELGIVHRDLKPDNVFLERSPDSVERVRVLDFGIAKLTGSVEDPRVDDRAPPRPETDPEGRQRLTTTLSAVGTPSYMAPEQVTPNAAIGPAADVWALGLLMFECLTGKRPPRTAEGHVPRAAIDDALAEAKLADLVVTMLAEAPDERPSIGVVKERLQSLELAAPKAPSSAWTSTIPDFAVPPVASPARWTRSTLVGAALVGAATVVILGLAFGPRAEPRTTTLLEVNAARPASSVANAPQATATTTTPTQAPASDVGLAVSAPPLPPVPTSRFALRSPGRASPRSPGAAAPESAPFDVASAPTLPAPALPTPAPAPAPAPDDEIPTRTRK